MLQLPDDSWREWLRETGFQGLLLFWGPANKIAAKLDVEKLIDYRRTRLQIHSDSSGLERYQAHIKLFHFTLVRLWPQKKFPGIIISVELNGLAGSNSSADCLRHSAGVGAEFAARAVVVVQRQPPHSRGPSVAALFQPVFFLRGLSASLPSIVLASAPFAAWPRLPLEEHFH